MSVYRGQTSAGFQPFFMPRAYGQLFPQFALISLVTGNTNLFFAFFDM